MALWHGGCQFLSQMRGRGMAEHGRAMGQLLGLRHCSGNDPWVRMSHRNTHVHPQQISVFRAIRIPQVLALAFLKDDRIAKRRKARERGGIILIAAGCCGVEIPVGVQGVLSHNLTPAFKRVLSGSNGGFGKIDALRC